MSKGIVYEYEDGGTYCGEWQKDYSHGYGCGTGPGGRGRYEGLWENGGQVSGVYQWPNGMKYLGSWKNHTRDGLGKESREDGTEYCGEFTRGSRGPYGVTKLPNGVYRGSWRSGKQDGEGEETYVDGGCYRGQYKNGIRSGFGTRTSAAYEHRDKDSARTRDTTAPTSKQRHLPTLPIPFSGFKRTSVSSQYIPGLGANNEESSEGGNATAEQTGQDKITNMQIYEGEWREDKRHGYGVIKCIGSYTYYGQWSANMRTGYGVMVFESGVKEEGQWQNGELVAALRRKKLHLKSHQLEAKVQTAHTQAIQAADTARNKALLAESRASSAMAKAKIAQGVILTAENNAQLAREKAELYKNATRISEGLKSPMSVLTFDGTNTPPSSRSCSGSRLGSHASDSPLLSNNRLDVGSIPHAPSFETLQHILPHQDSDNGEEDYRTHSPAARRRKKFSSSDSGGSYSTTDSDVNWKRQEFQASESEYPFHVPHHELHPVHRRISEGANVERERGGGFGRERRSFAGSRHPILNEEEEPLEQNDGMRRRRIDKTTGEVKDYGSDEDTAAEDRVKRTAGKNPKPHPLKHKGSIAMDMLVSNLNEMANWNKMIAYFNFFLLIFLVLLIIGVVISINYYQLSSYYREHTPEERGPSPGFVPMA